MISLFNHATKGSVNTIPVHAMHTYQRRRGKAPLILNLGITWSWVVKVHAQTSLPPVPIKHKIQRAPEQMYIFAANRNPLPSPEMEPRVA